MVFSPFGVCGFQFMSIDPPQCGQNDCRGGVQGTDSARLYFLQLSQRIYRAPFTHSILFPYGIFISSVQGFFITRLLFLLSAGVPVFFVGVERPARFFICVK
jgi:hypothetical protein